MTAEQRIDEALDSVLKASGSRLANYTMHKTLKSMRDAMRKIMSDNYIAGVHADQKARLNSDAATYPTPPPPPPPERDVRGTYLLRRPICKHCRSLCAVDVDTAEVCGWKQDSPGWLCPECNA